jgi:hypothetical protein
MTFKTGLTAIVAVLAIAWLAVAPAVAVDNPLPWAGHQNCKCTELQAMLNASQANETSQQQEINLLKEEIKILKWDISYLVDNVVFLAEEPRAIPPPAGDY